MKWPLAWRMLAREWRSGELGLLAGALTLGVMLVAGIGLFADRLEQALNREASQYLGADRILRAAEPLPESILQLATDHRLRLARTVSFPTMVYPPLTGDAQQDAEARSSLASVKAVDDNYPLLGQLTLRDADGQTVHVDHGPPEGEIWVDENVLNQLDLTLGQSIEIGSRSLLARYVIEQEADASNNFYGMGARTLLSERELARAELISLGSRVEYRYLLAGSDSDLAAFTAASQPLLPPDAKLLGLQDGQSGLASALDKAKQFLQLAGSLGVLLAALAGAFAAQCYCERQTEVIATLKTLGADRKRIRQLISGQLSLLWLLATLTGLALGALLHWGMLWFARPWLPEALPAAGYWPWLQAVATGLIAVLCFIYPSFFKLAQVAPWQIFRAEQTSQWLLGRHLLLAVAGVLLLLHLYSQSWQLIGGLLAGVLLLAALLAASAQIFLKLTTKLPARTGSPLHLALNNLQRERWLTTLQLVVFSLCFMLLGVMFLLRSTLLAEWERQIPADAPNVFLLNVAPGDVEPLQHELAHQGFGQTQLYPMARARLTHIDGEDMQQRSDSTTGDARREHNSLRREVNLSWATEPPPDNTLTAGQWPAPASTDGMLAVSVESEVARELSLQLGSELRFRAGSQQITARVSSLRQVNWDKMTPNFYFLFEPGAIEQLPATWITSFYRDASTQPQLTRLLRQFPQITMLPVDQMLTRIKTITDRATLAVEAILWLVLLAGVLVLLSCLKAGMPKRLHTGALLRALGAERRLLTRAYRYEFACLGILSGLIAALAAQLAALALQQFAFKTPLVLHPWLWLLLPTIACLLLALLGSYFCRPAVNVSPLLILRQARG